MMHQDDIRTDRVYYEFMTELSEMFLTTKRNWQLAFVRSLHKRTEATPLPERYILIFDMQLIVALKTLTRLFYGNQRRLAGGGYFGKLLAEEALIAGEYYLAHRAFADYKNYPARFRALSGTSVKNALKHFSIQEMFVLLHESCHIMMATGHEMAANFRDMADLLTEDMRPPNWAEHMHASISRDFPGQISKERLQANSDAEQHFISENKALLVQEFACDYFATTILSQYAVRHNISLPEMFEAVLLCLQHVKVLMRLRVFVQQLRNGEATTGVNHCVRLIEARHQRLATWSFPTMILQKNPVDKLDGFGRHFTLLSNRSAERVENPLFQDYLPQIVSIELSNANGRVRSVTPEQRMRLAAAMGWNGLWASQPDGVEQNLFVL